MKQNIVLVGFMGSGKSYVGRNLAKHLNWQFVDTDRKLEREVGMKIASYYKKVGKEKFLQSELEIIKNVSRYHEAVISFGGNFILNNQKFSMLKKHGYIVGLRAEPFRIIERINKRIGKRPTVDYDNLDDFVFEMIRSWKKVYSSCDLVINTTYGEHSRAIDKIIADIDKKNIKFKKRRKDKGKLK